MTKRGKLVKVKKMLWQSMRIFRGGFTVPDLLRTAPGSSSNSAKRWIKKLEEHGFIMKAGGVSVKGQYPRYRLLVERETVIHPSICIKCGNPLHMKCFFLTPEEKKETETEEEKKKEEESSMWRDVPSEWKEHLENKLKNKAGGGNDDAT